MPARVVVVLHDPALAMNVAEAVKAEGIDVAVISNAHDAWEVLKEPQKLEVLVVSSTFGPGMPTGVSLTRHVRFKQGNVHAVLLGDDESSEELLARYGVALPANASAAEIAEIVAALTAGNLGGRPD